MQMNKKMMIQVPIKRLFQQRANAGWNPGGHWRRDRRRRAGDGFR